MGLHGLTQINFELNSVCNKRTLCTFCGHQNAAVHPHLKPGQVSGLLLWGWAEQVPPGTVVQFHRDSDPLAYTGDLSFVLKAFAHCIRSLVTHGETLHARATELIGSCESITVSIFRGDPDREIQLDALRAFVLTKGDRLPRLFLKVVGDMTDGEIQPYLDLGVPVMRRLLHVARSNARYARSLPAMPEHGLCLDLLHHPSVAWDGRVYVCNRLDPTDRGLIGNLTDQSLEAIWNGPVRQSYIRKHLEGRRTDVPPCRDCEYYGVPTA